jgi:hypothetical protein
MRYVRLPHLASSTFEANPDINPLQSSMNNRRYSICDKIFNPEAVLTRRLLLLC